MSVDTRKARSQTLKWAIAIAASDKFVAVGFVVDEARVREWIARGRLGN